MKITSSSEIYDAIYHNGSYLFWNFKWVILLTITNSSFILYHIIW